VVTFQLVERSDQRLRVSSQFVRMPWPTHGLSVPSSTADKRILRLIAKWLKVGTVEDERRTRGVCGAPQGAVISPILANVYLHYVFDLWVHRWRLTKASGDMMVIRYADDTIVGFQHEHEARTFLNELKGRMRKFELPCTRTNPADPLWPPRGQAT
jgi:retron-type reverse transcriptase